jgi:hypothetical protein
MPLPYRLSLLGLRLQESGRLLMLQPFACGECSQGRVESGLGVVPIASLSALFIKLGLPLLKLSIGWHGRQTKSRTVDADVEATPRGSFLVMPQAFAGVLDFAAQ